MKKRLCLTLLLALLLTACAQPTEPLPLSVGEPNTAAGKLSFTLADFYRTESLAPPIPVGDYPVYDAPEGTEFLVAVLDVENLASFGYRADQLLALTLTAGEATHAPTYLVQTGNGTGLDTGATISSGAKARVYCLFPMTPETVEVTLTATVGSQPYTALLTPGNNPDVVPTSMGQTLRTHGISLKLESFTAKQKLKPTSPAPLHTFFDAGQGRTHLVLTATVTNFGTEPIPCDQIAGVTVGTTVCTPILESADGTDLSDSDAIDPGQSRKVYFAAAFDADKAATPATVTVAFPTATYRLTAQINN